MKTIKIVLSAGIAIVTIAVVFILVFAVAAPAFSATLTALLAPTPPPGEAIPLKPIAGLTSLNATVKIDVNGLINGKRAQGDLNAVLTTNDQKESKVTVTGSLLGEIAAQVGGSLVGLFTPSSVDIYKVPEGTYIVANSLIPVCVKPKADKSPEALDDVSPQSLLSMLTSSDVARGKLVGEETLNGVRGQALCAQRGGFPGCRPKEPGSEAESLWRGAVVGGRRRFIRGCQGRLSGSLQRQLQRRVRAPQV